MSDGATKDGLIRRVVYVDRRPHIVIVEWLTAHDILRLAGVRESSSWTEDRVWHSFDEWHVWRQCPDEDRRVDGFGVDVQDGMHFYVVPAMIGAGASA
jgi:hypothetical protein